MAIETTILNHLVFDEEYGRKVIPFLKDEYFQSYNERLVFKLISEYVGNYNSFPSKEALAIDLSNKEGLNEDTFKNCKEVIENLNHDPNTKLDWILDQAEVFCQDKALYLAVMKTIKIMDEKVKCHVLTSANYLFFNDFF